MEFENNHTRMVDIDRLKGFAIFLVVLGHLTLESMPMNVGCFIFFESVIYKFHMALFIFLAGYVFMHTYPRIDSINDYLEFIRKKFIRLIPALIMISGAIAIGKSMCRHFIFVDNPPVRLGIELLNTVIVPSNSCARSMWFINVLFAYYMIIPPLMFLIRNNLKILVLIGVVVYFGVAYKYIPATNYFALKKVMHYLVFLSFGMMAYDLKGRYLSIVDKYGVLFIMVFIASMVLFYDDKNQIDAGRFTIELFSIPAVHYLFRSKKKQNNHFFIMLGIYTFPIYLMNTIAIGLTKGITLKFILLDGVNFLIVAPVFLCSGIFIPIIIKKHVFSKIRPLDIITN